MPLKPNKNKSLELLAPAGNLECGLAAISAGADAIYVGAPKFGARAKAGVSLKDIQLLVKKAHFFGVKIYVALNTIIYNSELKEVENLIKKLFLIEVDALIIQDMGILQLNIPPIPLHASTQCHNASVEQLQNLEKLGFEQAVLARELNLQETEEIAKNLSKLHLETFVHGALCVSYSGHCYISQALAKRSANRGECAQYCRLPYSLVDSKGKIIIKNSHLLSLKDLNRSSILPELIQAGTSSFKIEGRLKSISYVKNITAYYSSFLNQFIETNQGFQRASQGDCLIQFTPDPSKSFSRGKTTFQFEKGNFSEKLIRPQSPKSEGEFIGKIKLLKGKTIILDRKTDLANGDGLAFYTKENTMDGTRVNKILSSSSFLIDKINKNLSIGTSIYRNLSVNFENILNNPNSTSRERWANLKLKTFSWGFYIRIIDFFNPRIEITVSSFTPLEEAKKDINSKILNSLQKTGGSGIKIKNIDISNEKYFLPISSVNELRREALETFTNALLFFNRPRKIYRTTTNSLKEQSIKIPQKLSYLYNISNQKAQDIYKSWGGKEIAPAFEIKEEKDSVLMTCKHCIKRHIGYCSKNSPTLPFKEPLFLLYGKEKIKLHFDCKKCEMLLLKP